MPDTLVPTLIHRAAGVAERTRLVRRRTLALTDGLSPEDMVVQSMPDASPVKWHLAHTTWFFETFVLGPHAGVDPFDPDWGYLFNSYYEAVGARHPRAKRGLLSRPSLGEVLNWRSAVDAALGEYLSGPVTAAALDLVELGLHHEEQHQELLLTDVKHLLAQNPLRPAAGPATAAPRRNAPGLGWIEHSGGLVEIGHGGRGFAFDNEGPRHKVWLEPFALADRPVTCGEWLEFMADGGYRTAAWWLSDGWARVQAEGWRSPLYWREEEPGDWRLFTFHGERPLDPDEPVCHISHFEADAFAAWARRRWPGVRLPTEAEWEAAFAAVPPGTDGSLRHPAAGKGAPGQVWEWTASAYLPYPGFAAAPGAVGEYNGKFMSGQMVLRGASVATAPGHSRPTYRNFFPPDARWQFSGVRLARSLAP